MGNIKSLVQVVDMLTEEISLENNNKYKLLFLKKFIMAPEIYLDVLIIDPDYGKSQIPTIENEEAPREETQVELRSFF